MSTSVTAPTGAHFEYEEVKTDRGTKSLGEVPMLVWDNAEALRTYYTDEGVLSICDGTSLRVSFQGIARRYKAANKSDDEIAKAQIDFRPGRRVVGASTPQSKAAKAAKAAVEKTGNADAVLKLLGDIESGKLSLDDIEALTSK